MNTNLDTNESHRTAPTVASPPAAGTVGQSAASHATAWHANRGPSIDDVIGGGTLLTMLCAIGVLLVDGRHLAIM